MRESLGNWFLVSPQSEECAIISRKLIFAEFSNYRSKYWIFLSSCFDILEVKSCYVSYAIFDNISDHLITCPDFSASNSGWFSQILKWIIGLGHKRFLNPFGIFARLAKRKVNATRQKPKKLPARAVLESRSLFVFLARPLVVHSRAIDVRSSTVRILIRFQPLR